MITPIKKPQVTKPKKQAKKLDDPGYVKLGASGPPGSGKTRFLKGPLLLGQKVFLLSSDAGGSGSSTIRQELIREGHKAALENLFEFEVSTSSPYEDVADFLEDPACIDLDGKTIYDWDPDMIAWDGFSNWQMVHLDKYILDFAPGTSNSSEFRREGLKAEQQDWDAIKRATARHLGSFCGLHNVKTGKKWNKYVTFYEKPPEANSITGLIERTALIQGSIKNFTGGYFDVFFFCRKNKKKANADEGANFDYLMESASHAVKTRGYKFNDIEEADPLKLWQKILSQMN